MHTDERGVETDADVLGPPDLLDEIVGHAHAQGSAAHEQRHRRHVPRQMHGRLARGITGADEEDVLTHERRRLRRRRAVEHAFPQQGVEPLDLQAMVRDAGGDEDGPGPDRDVSLEGDDPFVAVEGETGDLSHDQELGAERDRLVLRPRCQVRSADAAREPEIVPDHRARPRLPARRLRFDDQRAQPVRGAVDRGGETGRACPGDDQIVEPTLGFDVPAEHLGDLGVRRIPQHLVAEDHRGQMASVAQLVQHPPALVGIVGQELAGDGVARG